MSRSFRSGPSGAWRRSIVADGCGSTVHCSTAKPRDPHVGRGTTLPAGIHAAAAIASTKSSTVTRLPSIWLCDHSTCYRGPAHRFAKAQTLTGQMGRVLLQPSFAGGCGKWEDMVRKELHGADFPSPCCWRTSLGEPFCALGECSKGSEDQGVNSGMRFKRLRSEKVVQNISYCSSPNRADGRHH